MTPPNAQIRIVHIDIAIFKPNALAIYKINKPIAALIARRVKSANNLNKRNAMIIAITKTMISVNTMMVYCCLSIYSDILKKNRIRNRQRVKSSRQMLQL
jgi:hypothetical protein